MHADERLRFEEHDAPSPVREAVPGAERDDRGTDGLLIRVLSATRTPAELERLAQRLLRAAREVRQG